MKALDGRPIAVSASRDGLIRVWDIQKGICLRVLEGHTSSVRSLDVAGNVCVTGSYDCTARVSLSLVLEGVNWLTGNEDRCGTLIRENV